MALQKPDDGIRPISVGEVLRYLLAKCFCNVYEGKVKLYLWPRQIGVTAPLGAVLWCEPNNTTEVNIIFLADLAQEHYLKRENVLIHIDK